MNAYPPLPPFFPSTHRLPGHVAREQRRRTEAVIMPPEARIARRIFGLDDGRGPAWARRTPAPPRDAAGEAETSRLPPVMRLLWKLLAALVRPRS